jgi:hypothetical protein
MRGVFIASLNARAAKVKSSQIELRPSETGDRSSQIPLSGFSGVFRANAADFVQVSEVGLGFRIASVGGYSVPVHCLFEILLHALPKFESHSEQKLSPSVSFERFSVQCLYLRIHISRVCLRVESLA